MKRNQLLALSILSLFTFACDKQEAIEPTNISENVNTEMSLENALTSVDSYRRNLIVEERFETPEASTFISGDYGNFYKLQSKKTYSFDATTALARKGTRSAKFEMRSSDEADGVIRSEAASRYSETNRHRWYGLSMYLPSSSWNTSSDWEIITQFWSQPDPGEEVHNPPIELFVSKGRMYVSIKWASAKIHTDETRDGKQTFDLGPVIKDRWVDFVYNINYSYGADGVLQVWRDGQLVIDHKGPNSYNDEQVPYFKFGIYKRGWDATTTKRVIYFDEVRVGNSNAVYNDVAPIRK